MRDPLTAFLAGAVCGAAALWLGARIVLARRTRPRYMRVHARRFS